MAYIDDARAGLRYAELCLDEARRGVDIGGRPRAAVARRRAQGAISFADLAREDGEHADEARQIATRAREVITEAEQLLKARRDALQMTGAEVAATRHLIGLTQAELAASLDVSRHSVKDWESGRFTARPGVVADIGKLRAEHDAETTRLARDAETMTIQLPSGPKPQGWYRALGARVLDAVPDAMIDWLGDE